MKKENKTIHFLKQLITSEYFKFALTLNNLSMDYGYILLKGWYEGESP